MHKWNTAYERIVFRHVKFRRDSAAVNKLRQFVKVKSAVRNPGKTVVGKRYRFNPLKMLSNDTPAKTIEKVAATEGFFCSELVANAYIYMGLLPEHPSGSRYLPVHFSTDKALAWENGAVMGQEYLIDFVE